MGQRPIAEGVFTWPSDEPRLIGSRCTKCGTTLFPATAGCAACGADETEQVLLDRRGPLYTFTTQEFPPKAPYRGPEGPDDWAPYGVGYVELGGVIRVEGRLTENDPAKLSIGQEMELTIIPFGTDDDGEEIVNFAFAPVASDN